ncbi:DUF1289 domain-containing protein, partial [Acinetobacter baumannii]|uniref:DUF1289 domain-containing protein n=1 Tax=Sphingomonas sp. GlSt437 TaxID=3389970 RepID=UPI003A840021
MAIITFTLPVAIESPCVGVCALEAARSRCTGCGRTTDEIARWTSGTPEWRRAVMAELPARLAADQSLARDCK